MSSTLHRLHYRGSPVNPQHPQIAKKKYGTWVTHPRPQWAAHYVTHNTPQRLSSDSTEDPENIDDSPAPVPKEQHIIQSPLQAQSSDSLLVTAKRKGTEKVQINASFSNLQFTCIEDYPQTVTLLCTSRGQCSLAFPSTTSFAGAIFIKVW